MNMNHLDHEHRSIEELEPAVRLYDEPEEVQQGWSAAEVEDDELVDDEWVEANTKEVPDGIFTISDN